MRGTTAEMGTTSAEECNGTEGELRSVKCVALHSPIWWFQSARICVEDIRKLNLLKFTWKQSTNVHRRSYSNSIKI